MRSSPHRAPITVLALASLPLLFGCGYITGGSTEMVRVQSVPSEATLTTLPGNRTFTTPVTLQLERKNEYLLTARKEGYRDAQVRIRRHMRTGPLIADLFLGFIISIPVDFFTGGWWDLQPNAPVITLPAEDGTETIVVRISVEEGETSEALTLTSEQPVTIEVLRN